MTRSRDNCAACHMALPPGAQRCPGCGHEVGVSLVVETGRETSELPTIKRAQKGILVVLAVLATIVGVFAVVGPGDEQRTTSSSTTSTTSTPVRRTTTTRPPPTTRGIAPLVLGAPTGISLLLLDAPRMEVVDLDSGVVRRLDEASNGGPPLPVSGGAFLQSDRDGTWSFFAPPFTRGAPTPIDGNVGLYPSTDPGRVWILSNEREPLTAVELDVASGSVITEVEIPRPARVFGPIDGGVVLDVYGSLYAATTSGTRLLATGQALAVGGNHVFFIGCDERARCTPQVLDIGTGRSIVVGEPVSASAYYLASFSPDGSQLALLPEPVETAENGMILVDTATGTTQQFATDSTSTYVVTPPSWTFDGAWVFWTGNDAVLALARGSDTPIRIDVGRRGLNGVTAVQL